MWQLIRHSVFGLWLQFAVGSFLCGLCGALLHEVRLPIELTELRYTQFGRPQPIKTAVASELTLVLQDAQDGVWNRFGSLEAALILDRQFTAAERRAHLRGIARWVELNLPTAPPSSLPRELAHFLLLRLHQDYLIGGYAPDASAPSITLTTGKFNCVSATLLFEAVARHAGLTTRVVCQPGHVRHEVWVDHAWVALETTVPTGIPVEQPLGDVGLAAQEKGPMVEAIIPFAGSPSSTQAWQPVDAVRLVALPTFNLGADALAVGKRGVALRANELLVALCPAWEAARDHFQLASVLPAH